MSGSRANRASERSHAPAGLSELCAGMSIERRALQVARHPSGAGTPDHIERRDYTFRWDQAAVWRPSCRCYWDALEPAAVLFVSQSWMVAKYVGANRCNDAISALLPVFASSCR